MILCIFNKPAQYVIVMISATFQTDRPPKACQYHLSYAVCEDNCVWLRMFYAIPTPIKIVKAFLFQLRIRLICLQFYCTPVAQPEGEGAKLAVDTLQGSSWHTSAIEAKNRLELYCVFGRHILCSLSKLDLVQDISLSYNLLH